MNLMYMKYAVEIAACGSINKAAEKLYIGQPNLSRAIKELETSLGVTIFERSAKGMEITPQGEVFLKYAKSILSQVDTLEGLFRDNSSEKKHFSVSVPRASYICEAFARFSKRLSEEERVEALYKETNAMRTVKNVVQQEYNLGILRYAKQYDSYYKQMLDEKGISYELLTEFSYVIITGAESPLAKKEKITFSDLFAFTEIAHADPYVPSLSMAEVRREELPEVEKRIFVFERASQFELLAENPNTFMWVSPVPKNLLDRYNLKEITCDENKKIYKDVIIHRNDYRLSELDKNFISEVCNIKRSVL